MRKFKCYDCDHIWQLPHGQGGRGSEQTCPKCGSSNVHRIHKTRHWDWGVSGGQRRRSRNNLNIGSINSTSDDSKP